MTPYSIALVASLALTACTRPPTPSGIALTRPQAAAIADSVRAFAATVARGVSDHGPTAWRGYFADTPAFFMASEGRLVFPTGDSATRGIEQLGRVISHIELRWGDSLRVDPLAPGLAVLGADYHEIRVDQAGRRIEENGYFTGLAQHRAAGWQFRDAHWSVLAPPPKIP